MILQQFFITIIYFSFIFMINPIQSKRCTVIIHFYYVLNIFLSPSYFYAASETEITFVFPCCIYRRFTSISTNSSFVDKPNRVLIENDE